jgi:hypothetical protein
VAGVQATAPAASVNQVGLAAAETGDEPAASSGLPALLAALAGAMLAGLLGLGVVALTRRHPGARH